MPELDLSKDELGQGHCSYPDRAPQTREVHRRSDLVPRPTPEVGPRTNKLKKAHQKERSPKPKGRKGLKKGGSTKIGIKLPKDKIR